ncbi:serine/threonine-protein phosphatase 7 long form homolog [Gossypium raimondii]|uniref:serine/threonine-protein phosphatase 7 long form homolog n=1 Tax=Gossypium raimondii TaxID=29730 RepID=UPI00227C9C91|nr:serine/threonine-protein phosphatase 7 long form homolog [Gossypium raimondii]
MPYLEQAVFRSVALIRTFDLRYDLISALVERWRPETHTFHFPCRECIVTLEDVALQLGLLIDGSPVTRVNAFTEPAALCYILLGDLPDDDESNFSGLKFTWLKGKFGHLSANATEGKLMCAARAYIMHIIGGVLMPHSNNNKVHIMHLHLLADLSNVCSYSWGFTVLAVLYRELCRTTKPTVVDMGGCLTLLQSWAIYRIPFLASVSYQPYVYPPVNRWNIYPGVGRYYTVPIYRLMIEQHVGEGFIWMSYRRLEIATIIPSSAYFGCVQYIPDPPCEVRVVHDINKLGKPQLNWRVKHQRFVALWNNRMARIPQMVMASDLQPSVEYMQ